MMFDLISPFDHRTSDLFRYFDDLGRDAAHNEGSAAPCRTDILEFDDRFELLAELPGFAKDEIHLDIDGDRLTISAAHKGECGGQGGSYLRRERRCGPRTRSFDISAVAAEGISASYENGVLTVRLPKKSAQKPVSQRIEIR